MVGFSILDDAMSIVFVLRGRFSGAIITTTNILKDVQFSISHYRPHENSNIQKFQGEVSPTDEKIFLP